MSLGERIREIRKDNRINQTEFAKRMLVSASYISKVEAGKEKPSDIFLKLMALEFNISLDWLLNGNGSKKITQENVDYFERNQDYNKEFLESMRDFQMAISAMPESINASIYYMLEEYSHILKSEFLTESQKILTVTIISDIMVTIVEMIDKSVATNKNDEKELFRFDQSSRDFCNSISKKVYEIKNILVPQKNYVDIKY